jgi:AcrR family transcriptional regulator
MPDTGPSPAKQRILDGAAELFARNGFAETSVADLGDAVGLGRGALYHHISSKEALLYEIGRVHVLEMVEFGEHLLEQDLPADVKLRTLSRRLMTTIATNLDQVIVFYADFRSLSDEHREELSIVRDRFERVWATIFADGARGGLFRRIDPTLVKAILGMHNYSYVWLRTEGRLGPAEIADLITDTILHGVALAPAGS